MSFVNIVIPYNKKDGREKNGVFKAVESCSVYIFYQVSGCIYLHCIK